MHPVPSIYGLTLVLTLVVGVVVTTMATSPVTTTTETETENAISDTIVESEPDDDGEEPNKPHRPVPPPPWRKHHNHSGELPPHHHPRPEHRESPDSESDLKPLAEGDDSVWLTSSAPVMMDLNTLRDILTVMGKIKGIDGFFEKVASITPPPPDSTEAPKAMNDDEFARRAMFFLERIARVPFPPKEPEPEPEPRERGPPVEVAKVPKNGPPGVVTIRVLPRSQWDPAQRVYQPARVVLTRAFRMCMEMDATLSKCVRWQDAWATAVCRENPWTGFGNEVRSEYRLLPPHRYAVFHTFDNLTYQEVPVSTDWTHYHPYEGDQEAYPPSTLINSFDWILMGWARRVAKSVSSTIVMRWSHGHFWYIPAQHHHMGERALSTGRQTHVETLEPSQMSPDDLDDRPMYIRGVQTF